MDDHVLIHLFFCIYIERLIFSCACMLSPLSHFRLFATPQSIDHQAPLSMGFSRQELWSGLPFPPTGDLLDPGIEPQSLTSPALAGRFITTDATWEAPNIFTSMLNCQGFQMVIPKALFFAFSSLELHLMEIAMF